MRGKVREFPDAGMIDPKGAEVSQCSEIEGKFNVKGKA